MLMSIFPVIYIYIDIYNSTYIADVTSSIIILSWGKELGPILLTKINVIHPYKVRDEIT